MCVCLHVKGNYPRVPPLALSLTSGLLDNSQFPVMLIPQKPPSLHRVDRNCPDTMSQLDLQDCSGQENTSAGKPPTATAVSSREIVFLSSMCFPLEKQLCKCLSRPCSACWVKQGCTESQCQEMKSQCTLRMRTGWKHSFAHVEMPGRRKPEGLVTRKTE